MLLVDTNIIASLYVRSAHTNAVEELFAHDAVWRTEPLALIELSNVLIAYEGRVTSPPPSREIASSAPPRFFSRTCDG